MAGPAESAFDGRIRQPGTVSTWARRPTARLARGRIGMRSPPHRTWYLIIIINQSINKTKH